jgi:hypothetical protein
LFLRRERAEAQVLLPPLLAALCLLGTSIAFHHARDSGLLGSRTGATVTVWLLSWAFGLASYRALSRAPAAPPEVPRLLRVYAFLASAACVWVTLHLSRYGLIGLRTWRW